MSKFRKVLRVLLQNGNDLVLLILGQLFLLQRLLLKDEYRHVHVVPILLLASVDLP